MGDKELGRWNLGRLHRSGRDRLTGIHIDAAIGRDRTASVAAAVPWREEMS